VAKQFVAEIKDRDAVNAIFLVKEKIMAMAKNGKPYMNLRLMDKSGDVEAKIWDNVDALDKLFEKDDFVRVRGKASVYMNKMQVVVAEISRFEENQVELADFLPESPRDKNEMRRELEDTVDSITNPHLLALMKAFLADGTFIDLYSKAPAAKGMHHVYLGGLLEHSLSLVKLVKAIVPLYTGLNEDLLVVGALMHDAGKIYEMSFDRAIDYTDSGKLLGHITIGVELLDEKIRLVEGFPRELSMLLKHLILSHHGLYEYGSPKRPKTVEATILNYLDDLDSKINGISTHIAKESVSTSRWTSHHRLYDRYFFKGNGMEVGVEVLQSLKDEEPVSSDVPVNNDPPVVCSMQEKKRGFSNQPLKALENMDLF